MHRQSSAALFDNDVHPRLLFGPDDIPALREKVRKGHPGAALAEMIGRCERYTDPQSPHYVDPARDQAALREGFGGGQFNDTADAIHCLAFAYALTGEPRWAEKGIALLLAMARPNDIPGNICHVTLGGQVTFGYDLLHEAMSEGERETLRSLLRDHVVAPWRRERLDTPAMRLWGLGGNTFWRNFEKYMLALAATYCPQTDRGELHRIDALVRASLRLGLDEGGAIYEGPGYGWRDAEWLSFIAEVLRRMGVADLWAEEPRFAAMFRQWWTYLVLPGKRGQNNPCDAQRHKGGRPPIGMLLAARRLNDPVLQWAWERLGGRGTLEGAGSAPQCFPMHLGPTLLWEDDEAQELRPDEAGWPTSRNSGGFGLMTMRSGWADDDLYFSLLAGGRTPGCFIHQHVDAGHFNLFALNEAFSVDSGYGDILGRYHSVMMPHGQEPTRAPIGFGHMFFGGRPHAFAAGRCADYGCVDVGEQWECHSAFRHAMLVKAPGAGPYVVLLDSFNKGPELTVYRWQLNSEPGNRIDLDRPGERAVIHGRRHRLELGWAYPGPLEYAVPHRLVLAADEIDSHVWEAPDAGLGIRPRLKAKLYGYNGQLLTALVPRRDGEPAVKIERVTATGQLGLIIDHGEMTDTVVASPFVRCLDLAGVYGEARLVVVRKDREGRVLWWAAADANVLDVDGAAIVPRRGVATVLEEANIL